MRMAMGQVPGTKFKVLARAGTQTEESTLDLGDDRFHGLVAVDLLKASEAAVVSDDGSGLVVECFHALGKDLLGIVRALVQMSAFDIAAAGSCRRMRINVVDALADGADAPAGNALEQLIVGDNNADGDYREVRREFEVGKRGVEEVCLVQGAGIAVEDVTAAGIFLVKTV